MNDTEAVVIASRYQVALVAAGRLREAIEGDTSGIGRWTEEPSHEDDVRAIVDHLLGGRTRPGWEPTEAPEQPSEHPWQVGAPITYTRPYWADSAPSVAGWVLAVGHGADIDGRTPMQTVELLLCDGPTTTSGYRCMPLAEGQFSRIEARTYGELVPPWQRGEWPSNNGT